MFKPTERPIYQVGDTGLLYFKSAFIILLEREGGREGEREGVVCVISIRFYHFFHVKLLSHSNKKGVFKDHTYG